jgi:hypothetical protein
MKGIIKTGVNGPNKLPSTGHVDLKHKSEPHQIRLNRAKSGLEFEKIIQLACGLNQLNQGDSK